MTTTRIYKGIYQTEWNGFIEQTANDYDIPYSEVEWIYNKWNDKGLFYEKLEDYIKERA